MEGLDGKDGKPGLRVRKYTNTITTHIILFYNITNIYIYIYIYNVYICVSPFLSYFHYF